MLDARHGEIRADDDASGAIGRKGAVVALGRVRLSGFFGWLLRTIAHVYFLIGFRNRLVVCANWAWNYVTFDRGARLITGIDRGMDRVGRLAGPPHTVRSVREEQGPAI